MKKLHETNQLDFLFHIITNYANHPDQEIVDLYEGLDIWNLFDEDKPSNLICRGKL
jgi:hypothetical protein